MVRRRACLSVHPSGTVAAICGYKLLLMVRHQALPTLVSYLLLAFLLTARISHTLYKQSKQLQLEEWRTTRPHVVLFALLAVASLGVTWYYMLSFFSYSYHNWACRAGLAYGAVNLEKIERWLQDTVLFKQAWETVVETPQRFWWSGQIFLWATGWSLFLGVMGQYLTAKSELFYTKSYTFI